MEERRNYRKFYLWISIFCVGIAVGIAILFKFYETKGELTALIDVTLTTIALTIAILEILMVREIAEISQEAVRSALIRITEIISVSDISKGIKTAYDIQKYLKSHEYVIAHIRMQDLKFIVIPLKSDVRFGILEGSKRLSKIIESLSIDINNVDVSLITGKKNKSIDISKINGNLEDLVSVLIEYETYIKSLNSINK